MSSLLFLSYAALMANESKGNLRRPIPDRVVVLTFDDAHPSHFNLVRPVLKKHGFSATFFITAWSIIPEKDRMTWKQIAVLDAEGFEIGNHTIDHTMASNLPAFRQQIEGINEKCAAHGIARTTSFAYPGNAASYDRLPVPHDAGIQFARRGGIPEFPYPYGRGFAYDPSRDHPLLIPSAGDARLNWTLADFKRAVRQARDGKVAVLQYHGISFASHSEVSTSPELFERSMKYLQDNSYTVIALRDLGEYVDSNNIPPKYLEVVEARQRRIEASFLAEPRAIKNLLWFQYEWLSLSDNESAASKAWFRKQFQVVWPADEPPPSTEMIIDVESGPGIDVFLNGQQIEFELPEHDAWRPTPSNASDLLRNGRNIVGVAVPMNHEGRAFRLKLGLTRYTTTAPMIGIGTDESWTVTTTRYQGWCNPDDRSLDKIWHRAKNLGNGLRALGSEEADPAFREIRSRIALVVVLIVATLGFMTLRARIGRQTANPAGHDDSPI